MSHTPPAIYSKASAERILGVSVKRVEVWASVIFVVPEKGRATFVSKMAFKVDFVESRKERAQELKVMKFGAGSYPNKFQVLSDGRWYSVMIRPSVSSCDCADLKAQLKWFRRGACKHIYAVLNTMNYGSLSEYMEQFAA